MTFMHVLSLKCDVPIWDIWERTVTKDDEVSPYYFQKRHWWSFSIVSRCCSSAMFLWNCCSKRADSFCKYFILGLRHTRRVQQCLIFLRTCSFWTLRARLAVVYRDYAHISGVFSRALFGKERECSQNRNSRRVLISVRWNRLLYSKNK